MLARLVVLCCVATLAWAQQNAITGYNYVTSAAQWDASQAARTNVNRQGTGSPNGRDACVRLGESYFQLDASAGSNVWYCVALPSTWSQISGAGIGTVTSFSAGMLSPLFATSVATATSTPALSFTLDDFAADNIFGNFSAVSAVPSTQAIPACANDGAHALVYASHTLTCEAITTGGTGTVTTFSAGNLSPLFTSSVATATSTPALTFALSNAAQNSVFAGPASGGAGAPSFQTAPTIAVTNMTGTGGFAITGNAGTATNLASYPSTCSGQYSAGLSSGSNNCTAFPTASSSTLGLMKVDGTTETASAGVVSTANTTVNNATCTPGGSCNSNWLTGSITNLHVAQFTGTTGQIQDGGVLGTAAAVNTGTSGGTLCLLNAACVFSGGIALGTPASGVATNLTGTASSLTAGSATNVAGGATNDIHYQTGAGATGFIAPVDSAVLVTNGSGVPSESTTLPTGLAIQTPASIVLTNATGTASSLTAGTATNVGSGAANDLVYQTGAGATGFITPVDNAVLSTNGSGVPSESTTLPTNLAMQTPASITLTNATGLPITGVANGTSTGELVYWNGSAWTALAGNSSGTKFLQETSAGSISWASSSTGVTSFSGDGTLISNSSSTGAVAATLANAAANSVWGNATGSSAAPGYTTNPVVTSITTIPTSTCGSGSQQCASYNLYGTPGYTNGVPSAGIREEIPQSVTAYDVILPSAAATGIVEWTNSSNTVTQSIVTANGAAVGLGSVTNNAQTQAAIVPNTAPSAGQILVGNSGGTAYAPVTMSGSCTMASTGAITCAGGGSISGFGTLTAYDVYYMPSGGSLATAKADASINLAANPALCVASSTTVCVTAGGTVTNGSWSWTVGGALYISDATTGLMTQTAPSTSTHYVQRIGVALSATEILVMPGDVGTVQ
jgi:hypothetical protein